MGELHWSNMIFRSGRTYMAASARAFLLAFAGAMQCQGFPSNQVVPETPETSFLNPAPESASGYSDRVRFEAASMVPAAVLALVLVGVLMYLRCTLRNVSINEQARSVGIYCHALMTMMAWSMVYTDSRDLTERLGNSTGDSGFMVGLVSLGCFVGSFVGWGLLEWRPNLFANTRQVLIVSCSASALSVVPYAVVSACASSNSSWQWPLLLASRICQGIFDGVTYFFVELAFTRLTPASERPTQFVRLVSMMTLGLGLGPLIAAGAQEVEVLSSNQSEPSLLTVGLIQCLVYLYGAVGIIWLYPDISHVPLETDETSDAQKEHTAASSAYAGSHYVLMVAAFVCAFLRAYVVGGLEVATALLLEDSYDWDVRWIGVAIGLTFGASFMTSMCFDPNHLNALVRIASVCPIIGTLLMSQMSCDVLTVGHTECPALLLIGDVVVFALLYNAESIIHGIAMSHVAPDGSLLNASNVTLMNEFLTDGLGRFLGSWMARVIIDEGSQDIYAAQQIAGILLFCIAAEVVLATRVVGTESHLESTQEFNRRVVARKSTFATAVAASNTI